MNRKKKMRINKTHFLCSIQIKKSKSNEKINIESNDNTVY